MLGRAGISVLCMAGAASHFMLPHNRAEICNMMRGKRGRYKAVARYVALASLGQGKGEIFRVIRARLFDLIFCTIVMSFDASG